MYFVSSSRSIRFRNECAAIFAPCLVPHPSCTFPKKFCRSKKALLPAHLDAIRLSVLPMAISLNPRSIFMRAISFAPKKKGLRGSGILPSPMRLRKRFQKIRSCTAIRLTNKIFKS